MEGVGQSGPHLRINLSKSLSNIPRQGPPLEVSFHQLTDNMVAVSGAAPVSAEKELVSASEACHEEIKCLFDVISTGGERGIPLQQLLQVTLHGRECSKCLRDRQRAGNLASAPATWRCWSLWPDRRAVSPLRASSSHGLLGINLMAEVSPEQWLAESLRKAGIDPNVPIEYGAKPLIEHADRIGQPARPWLERFEPFVVTLHSIPLDFWSPIHFCVPSLAAAAGNRPETFSDLLRQAAELLAELHRRDVPLTRTEQYGVRASAEALGQNDRALGAVLETGLRLAARGEDPGWLLQIAVPELWNAAIKDEALFREWVRLVETAAAALADMGISVGYPFATGLGALAGHGTFLRECLALWLEKIVQVSRSLSENSLQPYGWFEYGLVGLSPIPGFPAESVTRALDIALNLADRGIHSGDLLQVSFGLAGDDAPQTVDAFLGAAERLSHHGIDPFFVLTGGLAQNAALLRHGPDDADGLERVLGLAQQLVFHGRSLRKTFEDGLPVLRELDDRRPGLFHRGFELAEELARAGIRPGHGPGLWDAARPGRCGHASVA